jgi:neopullulanase
VVLNHIGAGHRWMADLPAPDWLNTWPQFTETHHYRMSVQDIYSAPSDLKRFADGWFVPGMPDLNQRRAEVATYLTQMSIWWVETAGLSGIRTDTYSYSDKAFLARWSARLMQEYPNFNIVGEEWSPHPAVVAYWQRGKVNHDGYVSSAPSLMDFPLYGSLLAALNEADSHNTGFTKLYEGLAHDFVYPDPANLVLFEGNHDTPRLFTALQRDAVAARMALAFIATTRRIPQFFYGNELLMQSPEQRDDGAIRADMPGGWAGDTANAFTGAGLSAEQREMQAWVQRLFTWRKAATLVHQGALMQYAPQDGVYVFFRYQGARSVMVVLNKNTQPVDLPLARFPERLKPGMQALNVMTGERFTLGASLRLATRGPVILEISP